MVEEAEGGKLVRKMERERERDRERERSSKSRVFRYYYYGIRSKHGPRDVSLAATAWSGHHDHNDDDGQHDVVDHSDAARHEWRAAVPSATGVQSRATDGEIAQTRSC